MFKLIATKNINNNNNKLIIFNEAELKYQKLSPISVLFKCYFCLAKTKNYKYNAITCNGFFNE